MSITDEAVNKGWPGRAGKVVIDEAFTFGRILLLGLMLRAQDSESG